MCIADDLIGMQPGKEVNEMMLDSGCNQYDIEDEIKSMYLEVCSQCGTYQRSADLNEDGVCASCVEAEKEEYLNSIDAQASVEVY